MRIPPHEAVREFSHRIPHRIVKEGEVKDVVAGALELDLASTPIDIMNPDARR